jgi:hypothetical protein
LVVWDSLQRNRAAAFFSWRISPGSVDEKPSETLDKSLRSPLKVAIIPTFRSIVVQVRIFGLEMAKRAFPAEIFLLEMAFLPFSAF